MSAIIVYAPYDAVASSVALARDILGMASRQSALRRGADADPVLVATLDGGDALCGGGTTISADLAISEVGQSDLIWVAGFWSDPNEVLLRDSAVVPILKAQHETGTLIATHGPGAFLLAETGLLTRRIATTYEGLASSFRERYPDVDLQPSRRLTSAGGVFCSVGMNSGGDLLVSLVDRLYGEEVAASIAQWALVDSQRSYQVALVALDGQKYHGDEEILRIQDWLEDHYETPLTMAGIASRFAMSPRTLTRRFSAATGESPSHYVARLRMEIAKDLLRQSRLPIAEIALRVGYRDVGAFYNAFAKYSGQKPAEFRRQALAVITKRSKVIRNP